MSFLMDSTDKTAEVTQQASDRWERLVATLDSVSGAVTDATRAQLAQEAQSSGMLSTLEQLGVSTRDYIDASAGVAGGQEKLAASTQAAATKILGQSAAYRNVAEALAGAGVSQKEFVTAMESGDISGVQAKVDAYAEAQARLTGNVATATDIQSRFAAAVADGQSPLQALGGILNLSGADADGFATAADAAAQKSRALGTNADGAKDGVGGLGGAASTTTQAVDPMATALDAASKATSALDQATKFLALTLDQAAGNIISTTEAQNAYDASTQAIGQSQRDTAQATADLDQANQDLQKVQDDGTHTDAQLEEAHRKVADASDKVSDAERKQFDANVQTQSTAIALATSLGQQAGASGGLKGATDAATTSIQKSKDAFIAAQPEADRLSGKADQVANALFGIPKDTVARLAESGALGVQQAAQQTASQINQVPTSHNTTFTADVPRSTINDYANAIANVPTHKTTIMETIIAGAQPKADGGHLNRAAEGLRLLGGRGVSQRRIGSGDGVTWAEGITGEEFYISMKPGQEQRNRAFLSEAAVKLGGRTSFAPGTATPAPAASPVTTGSASRTVSVGSVSIGRFDDADRFFDRMAWEQLG
jgi:predicted  nucleic acid-binding Zn-ribbon protein